MAVNIKVTSKRPIDPRTDSMGRSWVGWDVNASDSENWEHNRGRHTFGPRIDDERYATLSFDGRIRLVVELTGRKQESNPKGGPIRKWSLEGHVLPPGHPVREALLLVPVPANRATVTYLSDPDVVASPTDTFLLTNNPDRWEFDTDELADLVQATAAGHPVMGRWSTGGTTQKIGPGDRAFLIRQGSGERGIFASGTFESAVFQDAHWNDLGGLANYADVRWDTVLDPSVALATETLLAELLEGHWTPQASGTQVKGALVDRLERLWAAHVSAIRDAAAPRLSTETAHSGHGRRLDARLRKEIEDLAQRRLMHFYEAAGWTVEDLRYGNSFDGKATRAGEVLYLEAKGTTMSGERVIVTHGEVDWAITHPGKCVIGIVSEIAVRDGAVDPDSGILRRYVWEPNDDDLVPVQYNFYPPQGMELE